jgi:adenine-specific DNA-methyltransferase
VPDQYDSLSKNQLASLLRKRDADKKLGLVWERDEIEADAAIDANFVACTIDLTLSDGAAPWRNLVIEGDNFDALRWLRMTYAHRVKCIYIDPPYNTGNKDWVYNDHYIDPNDRYRHSTWLEFLFRRLTLARDLLSNDGVILISINDENRAKLELMMDEALPGMRIGSFVWRTRTGGNDAKGAFLSDNHEHVLVAARPDFRFGGTEKTFEMYTGWDPVRRDWYRPDNITQPKDWLERPNGFYAMHDAERDVYYPTNPQRVWPSPTPKSKNKYVAADYWAGEFPIFPLPEAHKNAFPYKDQIAGWVKEGRIRFPEEERIEVWHSMEELRAAIASNNVPMAKNTPKIWADMPNLDFWIGKRVGFGVPTWTRYKSELKNASQPISSWITPVFEADTLDVEASDNTQLVSNTNQTGTTEIQDIFKRKAFTYAKPVSLIRELLRQAMGPNDLAVDFFAGSATTAQAVMELNAESGGDRRFIMVSSSEATTEEPNKNICRDLTAERIRLLNASAQGKYADLSADFAYLRTHEIDFDALNAELAPAEAWAALEAMHGFPLTNYDAAKGWNEHDSDTQVLILANQTDDALIERLRELAKARANAFIYSWTPGQLTAALGPVDFEIRPVRETLVKRFQQ